MRNMDNDNNHPKRLERAAWCSPVTAADRSLVFLTTMALAVVGLLSNSACGPSPTTAVPTPIRVTRPPSPTLTLTPTFVPITPPHTPRLSPTPSPTLTVAPTSSETATPTLPGPTRTATLRPTQPPWNLLTPVPTAPPGYDPSVECVVTPCLPAPQLVEPQEGAQFVVGSRIELKWTWVHCLPAGWMFAIRIADCAPPHSYHYENNPELISCQDGQTFAHYFIDTESHFARTPGTYYWNIAVARSVGGGWERLSSDSEIRTFTIIEPEDGNDALPPCPPNC
jgi:hypothetical protein